MTHVGIGGSAADADDRTDSHRTSKKAARRRLSLCWGTWTRTKNN